MEEIKLLSALEAVLFACGEPVPIARISLVFEISEEEVISLYKKLSENYEKNASGIRLIRIENSLQLCSAPEHSNTISKIIEHRQAPKLSVPALEALSVIAYFQPVTRAYIEQIRGVDSTYTVNSLIEKGLIEISGKLDAPGRPSLLVTTPGFLRVMGISSLDELPKLPEMNLPDGIEKLREEIEKSNEKGKQLSIDLEKSDYDGGD